MEQILHANVTSGDEESCGRRCPHRRSSAGNAFNVSGFVLALSSYASPVLDGF